MTKKMHENKSELTKDRTSNVMQCKED